MLRTSHACWLAIAACLALGLGAPGPSQAQPRPTAIDPCGLLAAAEVTAALGEAVQPGRRIDDGLTEEGAYSTVCMWVSAAGRDEPADLTRPMGGRSFVILNVMNWPQGGGQAQKFLDDFQLAFESHEIAAKPVAVEVGADQAIWWGDGVAARRADVSFGVSVVAPADAAQRQARAESLARAIVKRLD